MRKENFKRNEIDDGVSNTVRIFSALNSSKFCFRYVILAPTSWG